MEILHIVQLAMHNSYLLLATMYIQVSW